MEQKYTPCPVYRKCGGCQLQNLDYQRQLRWKQDRCEKLLDEFGKIEPILGMEQPLSLIHISPFCPLAWQDFPI